MKGFQHTACTKPRRNRISAKQIAKRALASFKQIIECAVTCIKQNAPRIQARFKQNPIKNQAVY